MLDYGLGILGGIFLVIYPGYLLATMDDLEAEMYFLLIGAMVGGLTLAVRSSRGMTRTIHQEATQERLSLQTPEMMRCMFDDHKDIDTIAEELLHKHYVLPSTTKQYLAMLLFLHLQQQPELAQHYAERTLSRRRLKLSPEEGIDRLFSGRNILLIDNMAMWSDPKTKKGTKASLLIITTRYLYYFQADWQQIWTNLKESGAVDFAVEKISSLSEAASAAVEVADWGQQIIEVLEKEEDPRFPQEERARLKELMGMPQSLAIDASAVTHMSWPQKLNTGYWIKPYGFEIAWIENGQERKAQFFSANVQAEGGVVAAVTIYFEKLLMATILSGNVEPAKKLIAEA